MSYHVSKYPHGTFSWADVASTNFSQTRTFLEKLFGWTSVDMPTGEGKPDYTMFYLDGIVVAGGAPTYLPEVPSFWMNYVSVDDVDEAVAKAELLGAKILMPAMDVFDSGRMANIQDPEGAVLGLWQPKSHIGAKIVNTVGAMSWNELYVANSENAKEFYGKLFDWTFLTDETGYTTIQNGERMNGGVFQMTAGMISQMPPCWMPYFTVENLAKSVEKVKELNGRVYLESKDVGPGRIATIADPTGAGMLLIEMSVDPEHWKE